MKEPLLHYATQGGDNARKELTEAIEQGLEGAQQMIASECHRLREILLAKNRAYGNSALDPVRIFSKASSEEQIRVRLDDKVSRIIRGEAAGEDVILDLIGYFVLLRIARRIETERSPEEKRFALEKAKAARTAELGGIEAELEALAELIERGS